MKRVGATTRVGRSKFVAVLLTDSVGLGILLAVLLFVWMWSRDVQPLVAVWLALNAFVLGGVLPILALSMARGVLGLEANR